MRAHVWRGGALSLHFGRSRRDQALLSAIFAVCLGRAVPLRCAHCGGLTEAAKAPPVARCGCAQVPHEQDTLFGEADCAGRAS